MIPDFSFFWDRVGDRWLVSRTAAAVFAGSVLIVVTVFTFLVLDLVRDTGVTSRILALLLGVSGSLSLFFFWSGMFRFWKNVDQPRRRTRRVWYFVMSAGMWFGAVLYYLLVYLPSISNGFWNNDKDAAA